MNRLYDEAYYENYDFHGDDEGIEYFGDDVDMYYQELEMMFLEEELEALEMEGENQFIEDYLPEGFGEDETDFYDATAELAETLREVLHEEYQDASHEEMEVALFNVMESLTPAEGFNFAKVLSQVSKTGQQVLKDPTVGQIAKTVLPTAGAAVGTIFGGPLGTAVGSQLGKTAAQAFSGKPKPAPPPSVPTVSQPPPQGGSTAAAQLLQLTQNPDMLKSLLSLALGAHGKQSIPVGKGEQTVPVGAFMNLLSTLAGKATADAESLLLESDEMTAYLRDSEGDFMVDPAVPEDRAQALYETLLDAENQQLIAEAAAGEPWSKYFPFAKGAKLLVEYEAFINLNVGNGYVIEHTPNTLEVKIHIDKSERFNVPETESTVFLEYKQDGPGNRAVVVVNRNKYTNNNVTIRSGPKTREIFMSIEILGQRVDRITISRGGSDEAKLKFKAGGDEHVLILSRK
jgi:hypothetical protein